MGPGPRTIPGARPRVVSRELCVKQVGEGGSRCRCASLDALGVGDAWDVNDALRVGDAWDVNDALRVGDAWDVNDARRVGDAWDVNDALRVGDALGVADDERSLLVCTRVANASRMNPLIGAWAS